METAATPVESIDERAEWLAARKTGIGGSDAPVVMGVSPWKSPYALWCEKTGLESDFVDNEVTRWGRLLEPVIADEYERITGRKLIDLGSHTIQRHPKRSWQICTHDRLIEDCDGRGRGVLSIKYVGSMAAREWEETWQEEQGPLYYRVQSQHEMAVSDLHWGAFAVYIWGQGLKHTDFERNDNFVESLVDEERAFWKRVETGEAPPVDGKESTTRALKRLYPKDSGKVVDLPPQFRAWRDEMVHLETVAKSAEKRIEHLRNEVRKVLGDASEGRFDGRTVCTYRTVKNKGSVVAPYEYRTLRWKDEK